ncbi:nitrate reductase NapE component [Bacillus mesophilus]|uniref:Uncharacterized protein n=1 Tax=Bacillus mesophilus TaxID=1808955 RepID=A0A6M0Q474_9BACI|nr:hypothetical protein [Bacillus mesophilus]MBM7660290.1 nitrate reductase NapE component [Bacillus mesophilus]NEY71003.1 hypothetical protein [Bacillus mesophilus]
MWKKRIKVWTVSLLLSLLALPIVNVLIETFVLNGEEGSFFTNVQFLFMVFAVYATPVIILTAIPVQLLAAYVAGKAKRFKVLLSFLIHIIPAVQIGLFGGIGFISLTVLVALIFFTVDYLIMYKETSIKFRYLLFVPFSLLLLFSVPDLLNRTEDAIDYNLIKAKETPNVHLTVNEEKITIKPSSCWSSDDREGCGKDTEPYLLPIDPIGIEELAVSGDVEVVVTVEDEESYTMNAYYLDGNEVVQVDVTGNTFTLPSHIHEQVVKVSVTTDMQQILSFSFGIRNGNRN